MASTAEVRTRRTAALVNALVEKLYPMAPLKVFSNVTRELYRKDAAQESEVASTAALGMSLLRLKGEDAVELYSYLSDADPAFAKKTLVMLLKLGGHLDKNDQPTFNPTAEELAERERRIQTLRDYLTAMQGVSGHFLRSESRSLLLTKGEEKVLVEALENGKRVARLRSNAAKLIAETSFGLVSQRLGHAIQDELSGYDRFVSILEQQIVSEEAKDRTNVFQMRAWTLGVFRRITLLANLYESTLAMRGGALCSTIHALTFNGNPACVELTNRIQQKIFVPIEEMIVAFVSTGRLHPDIHEEFFITRQRKMMLGGSSSPSLIDGQTELSNSDVYGEFMLKESMIPTFIGHDLARRILSSGCECRVARSLDPDSLLLLKVDFDEDDGEEEQEEDQMAVDSGRGSNSVGQMIHSRMVRLVDKFETRSNQVVIASLLDSHRLLDNLAVMKQFMLLGQGDFAQHLIELSAGLLSRSTDDVSRMELLSCVEQAFRSSQLGEHDESFASRIDCFLLESAHSSLGWDAFSLDYHVDFPLDLIVSLKARLKYQRVFRFLWRLKRVQFSLEQSWKQQQAYGRRIESEPLPLRPVVHKCHLVRSEMVHFVTNLLSYVMFEVLETSFEQLKCDIQEARRLVDLIEAHNSYLADVSLKALIVDDEEDNERQLDSQADQEDEPLIEHHRRIGAPASKSPIFALRSADVTRREVRGLTARLDVMFDLILKFCALQDRLSLRMSEERQARALLRRSRIARQRELRWKTPGSASSKSKEDTILVADVDDEEDLNMMDEASARIVAEEYGEQIDAVASEFWESLSAFLSSLESSTSENLRFLGFRLDFNRFY